MIVPASLPPDIQRAYQTGLVNFVPSGTAMWKLLTQQQTFHPVHALDLEKTAQLDDPVAGQGMPAQLSGLTNDLGWRFLAAGSGLAGACHVGITNVSGTPQITGFSQQAAVEQAIAILGQLGKLSLVQNGNFTLSAVRVPWLKFEAFWLAGQGSQANNDYVIPYAGFPEASGLQTGNVYSAAQFLAVVQPLSKRAGGQTARTDASRIRNRADWYPGGRGEATKAAEKLEAQAQVRIDINEATADQISNALELELDQAKKIVKKRRAAQFNHVNDVAAALEQPSQEKIYQKKHLIGFGPIRGYNVQIAGV